MRVRGRRRHGAVTAIAIVTMLVEPAPAMAAPQEPTLVVTGQVFTATGHLDKAKHLDVDHWRTSTKRVVRSYDSRSWCRPKTAGRRQAVGSSTLHEVLPIHVVSMRFTRHRMLKCWSWLHAMTAG
jgi:hypothetical protein